MAVHDEGVKNYCRTSPVYPVGTQIVLADPAMPRDEFGNVIATVRAIPAGTTVEIIGAFIESGECDAWPIRYRTPEGTDQGSYLDDWALRPGIQAEEPDAPSSGTWEDPTMVTDEEGRVQSPPERRIPLWVLASLPPDYSAYCAASPIYSPGTRIVLSGDSMVKRPHPEFPASSRGPGGFSVFVPAGTTLEITGPSIEGGECDWWPIRFERPPLWGAQGEGESTGVAPSPSPTVEGYIWTAELMPRS